jgi:hypothetical protein
VFTEPTLVSTKCGIKARKKRALEVFILKQYSGFEDFSKPLSDKTIPLGGNS